MQNISELCIPTTYSIMDSIKRLDQTHERIVLVVENGFLKGVVTDSDIRKAILAGNNLSDNVSLIMTTNPVCVTEDRKHIAARLMADRGLDAVPVIEKDGKLLDIIFRFENESEKKQSANKIDVPVVIMAGGKGTRLAPLTDVLPKPLISIGAKTILERIFDSFSCFGCKDFYLSVNYKKKLIKAFLEDLGVPLNINYVEETDFYGTAGSLVLLEDTLKSTFFVSNCDILLDVDYSEVIRFHHESGNKITMLTSLKGYEIPYGIVHLEESDRTKGKIMDIEEKPSMNFLVNTGVYVLEPEVLALIPRETVFHITDLIKKCIENNLRIGAYPITENAWRDMGERAAMEQMINDYK